MKTVYTIYIYIYTVLARPSHLINQPARRDRYEKPSTAPSKLKGPGGRPLPVEFVRQVKMRVCDARNDCA